jgi:hypothetical protein
LIFAAVSSRCAAMYGLMLMPRSPGYADRSS